MNINLPIHHVWNFTFKSIITNLATGQNIEVIANKLNTESIIQQRVLHINRMTTIVIYPWDCSYSFWLTDSLVQCQLYRQPIKILSSACKIPVMKINFGVYKAKMTWVDYYKIHQLHTHTARLRDSDSFSPSLGLILLTVRYSSLCCNRKSSSSSEWNSAWGPLKHTVLPTNTYMTNSYTLLLCNPKIYYNHQYGPHSIIHISKIYFNTDHLPGSLQRPLPTN
jgi:hypothetical protein